MAKRILTAVIWLPIVALGFAFAPIWVIMLAISALSAIGVYELLWATGFVRQKRLCAYSMFFAALVPLWTYFGSYFPLLLAGVFLFTALCFLDGMLHQAQVKFGMVGGALFGALLIPCFLSAFLRLEMSMETRLIFALPLIYPFISDAGGYFVGRVCGKHKLAPSLSPKKTVEGSIGGLAGNVLGAVIFAAVMNQWFYAGIVNSYLGMILLGLVCSVVAQIGDLSFSLIKREFGIKDYGHLFLEHGGVLDRFDSVLFVTPLIEIVLQFVR